MAYIVEQPIKGNIYLYRVESYWNKEKRQPRQHRIYLGPKEKKTKLSLRKIKNANLISKSYGTVFLLNYIAKHLVP